MGFGSVNIEDTLSFLHTVTEAVKGSGERVVIQSSWGTFCNGIEHLDDAIFFVGAGIATISFYLLLINYSLLPI